MLLQEDKPTPKKCSTCSTLVQPVFMIRRWFQPSQCSKCVDKEIAAREIKQQIARKISARKRLGLPPRFHTATFKSFDRSLQPVAYKIAGEFAQKYKPTEQVKGLYFYGQPGCGKTHLISAIANYLVDKESIRFITSPELLLSIRKSFNSTTTEQGLLDQLSQVNLLIIDDIGSEKPTEWVQETLFVLIDRRYTNFMPTLFTSNYSLDQLKDRLGYRIASRIAEMGQVVELKANDYRIRKQK